MNTGTRFMVAAGLFTLAVGTVACGHSAHRLTAVGLDEKMYWDPGKGMLPRGPGGEAADSVAILDLSAPGAPRVVTTLQIANSVYGPPTNLAIDRRETIALVANSMKVVTAPDPKNAAATIVKTEPDDSVTVIDLTAKPARAVGSVKAGLQPSGIDIAPAGNLALVANRAGRSITVLSIDDRGVTVAAILDIGGEAADVGFLPDGKRALATLNDRHSVVVLNVDGTNVTKGAEITVGSWPYSLAITPNGKLALTGNMGQKTGSDGKPDTISVLDLEQDPPAVIATLDTGDGPEGLAISPDGKHAIAVIVQGGTAPADAPFYHRNAAVQGFTIDGKTVRAGNSIPVGALGEGSKFGPDGRFVYIGNFFDSDMSILRFDGDTLVDTGKRFKLPGHPAALQ